MSTRKPPSAPCQHEGTGTAGIVRCNRCGAQMGDNGVRISMTVTLSEPPSSDHAASS